MSAKYKREAGRVISREIGRVAGIILSTIIIASGYFGGDEYPFRYVRC